MNADQMLADANERYFKGSLAEQRKLTNRIALVAGVLFVIGGALGRMLYSEIHSVVETLKATAPSDVFREIQKLRAEQVQDVVWTTSLIDSQTSYVALDMSGDIILWSDGAEEMFGLGRNNAVGYGIAQIIPPRDRGKHRKAFERAMRVRPGETPKLSKNTVQCNCLHSDGKEFSVTIRTWFMPGSIAISEFRKRDS